MVCTRLCKAQRYPGELPWPGRFKCSVGSIRLVVFRALQESLINIYRHARATHAEVSSSSEENSITLTVADNGVGMDLKKVEQFNSSGASTGVGLTSIRERVRELGGHCHITSSPQGTSLTISLPK